MNYRDILLNDCQFDFDIEIHIISARNRYKLLIANLFYMKKAKSKPAKSKPTLRHTQGKKLKHLTEVKPLYEKGIVPLNDRVLVQPFDAEELAKTASGIIIPDTVSKEKPEQGKVVAVGLGKWENGKRIPIGVKVGERVLFSKYGYDEVKFEGVEYYILREESILAVIKN